MADLWSQLPEDLHEYLLDYITQQLNLDDLLRFSFVCQRWKSFSAHLLPPKRLPWLIVPYEGRTNETVTICKETLGFFSIYNHKVYKVETPELASRRICGSCPGGWLITLHESGEIQVFHPFSKAAISLPQVTQLPGVIGSRFTENSGILYTVPVKPDIGYREKIIHISSGYMLEFYIYKAVMSSTCPTTGSVLVIQGFSRKLALYSPGKGKRWIPVRGVKQNKFNDITFSQGNFFAVRDNGEVFVVDGIESSSPYMKLVISKPNYFMYYKTYLLESRGELFLLIRVRSDLGPTYESRLTQGFAIKKINVSEQIWVEEVDYIDKDHAVFVGINNAFIVSTLDVPDCKGNCIYFTDDSLEKFMFNDDCPNNHVVDNYVEEPFGGHDLGVYNLTANAIEKFYPSASMFIKPPPVWFMTSFH